MAVMRIVTSNEKNTLTSAERCADVEAVYAALGSPEQPIALWQEIKLPAWHADVIAHEPAATYHAFADLPIPISVPSRYAVLEEYAVQTKVNTAEFYDTGSAPRWFGVLRLEDLVRTNLQPFYVINTHFTNGCDWNNPDPAEEALFLRPYWESHFGVMKAEIDAIKGDDWTVFWGGDCNRQHMPRFGSAEKLAVGAGRVDKLAVIDRCVDTDLEATGTIVTLSDHDARWAKWNLSNRP